MIKTVQPYTLVSPERITNLYKLARRIDKEHIPGDVIECGVCNGGTAAVMAHFATRSKYNRTVWLFDSFQGMPQPTEEDKDQASGWGGKDVGIIESVRTVLSIVNANPDRVKIVEGWFENTFATVKIPKIALLNIDADWYKSVALCLDTFYDAVVPGGFISIDDYGHWPGCKKAVDEFFGKRNIPVDLHIVDYTARWLRKGR